MTRPGPPENLADITYLTVAEVATIMRVSKMSVYRLIHAGELECVNVGEQSMRVPECAVNKYLRSAVVPKKELRQIAEKPPARVLNAPRCPGRVSACPKLIPDQYMSI